MKIKNKLSIFGKHENVTWKRQNKESPLLSQGEGLEENVVLEGAFAHATGGCQSGQECCECSY